MLEKEGRGSGVIDNIGQGQEKSCKNDGMRDRERLKKGEGKSDSFFNIRLAGNVFLHSSVCLCVYFPVAVSQPWGLRSCQQTMASKS